MTPQSLIIISLCLLPLIPTTIESVERIEFIEVKSTLEETALRKYDVPPILWEVARCESKRQHWDEETGNVTRGEEVADWGIFQISEFWHLESSRRMNLDIFRLEDNIKYALYLYEQNGLVDWEASKNCWLQKE